MPAGSGRYFKADRPNQLWVSDFAYVSTWKGWLYVAFVVDVFARRIVGWRVSHSMRTDFVLDALEQALYARQPERADALIHHSDRGSQYVSIRYTERLAEAGIEPSVGSRGDSYDNALAETINGLYKTELIYRRAPWKSREAVELATLEWVPGSTTTDYWNPSAISRRPRLRQTTTVGSPTEPWKQLNLNQTASTEPGAVHGAASLGHECAGTQTTQGTGGLRTPATSPRLIRLNVLWNMFWNGMATIRRKLIR